MKIWQADFYKRPIANEQGQTLWELLLCTPDRRFIYDARCPQSQASSDWLATRLQEAAAGTLPDIIQVFRPQSLSLLHAAAQKLGTQVEATRRTDALKEELQARATQYSGTGEVYEAIRLEKPPPQALPEKLWGQEWRFGTVPAGEIVDVWSDRPVPILDLPESFFPIHRGIASTIRIPGVVIYGGRNSMQLARWLAEAKPVSLNYLPTEVGQSGGLVLEAGLVDRWIVATFVDPEVAKAAQNYEQQQQTSRGLHFLLVQPDDSGATYSGFWLLLTDSISSGASEKI